MKLKIKIEIRYLMIYLTPINCFCCFCVFNMDNKDGYYWPQLVGCGLYTCWTTLLIIISFKMESNIVGKKHTFGMPQSFQSHS